MTLLDPGEPPPHFHRLPPVPHDTVVFNMGYGDVKRNMARKNSLARCDGCGRAFRVWTDPDGWGASERWVPLRWWNFKLRKKAESR